MILTINSDYLPKSVNQLVFLMEIQCVFCVLGTEFLNIVASGLSTDQTARSENSVIILRSYSKILIWVHAARFIMQTCGCQHHNIAFMQP
jgi:hypothetical protein